MKAREGNPAGRLFHPRPGAIDAPARRLLAEIAASRAVQEGASSGLHGEAKTEELPGSLDGLQDARLVPPGDRPAGRKQPEEVPKPAEQVGGVMRGGMGGGGEAWESRPSWRVPYPGRV